MSSANHCIEGSYNNGALACVPLVNLPETWTGAHIFSVAGAASTPALSITGAPYTGGSTTTNFPQFYMNDGTGPTTFSATGTEIGINAPSGFTGNLEDYHINGGPSVFAVTYQGNEVITQTSSSQFALNITNSTAATSSTAQSSPFDIRTGQAWYNPDFDTGSPPTAAVSVADCWSHQVLETNGSNGSSVYSLIHNSAADNCVGSPSNSYVQVPYQSSWGVQTVSLAQPTAPTVALQGSGTGTTWTYEIVACIGAVCTQPSTTTGTVGPTTINGTNWMKVTWTAVTNADFYEVYRTVAGTSPNSTGGICLIPTGATLECDDKGLTGDATTAQSYNSTGQVFVGTAPPVGGGSGGGMFAYTGTAPTSGTTSGVAGWYGDSSSGNFQIFDGSTNIGSAVAESSILTVGQIPKAVGTTPQMSASAITDTNTYVTIGNSEPLQVPGARIALTADWTCGTGGTVATCTAGTIVGASGTPGPLTITLPSASLNWHWQCDGVVGQATAAAANTWSFVTGLNAPTNMEATYQQGDSASTFAGGATTGVSSTTATAIGAAWTLGAAGTKMPFHIQGTIEGSNAGGTSVSLYLTSGANTDLITIYRGTECSVSSF